MPEIYGRHLGISGVVQGVGFRPFLFSLAGRHGLAGRVSNTSNGVDLILEGPLENLDAFIRDIPKEKPLLSRITAIRTEPCPCRGLKGFEIVKSRESADPFTLISPDVSICDDCLLELTDPGDRRFEYPFINCTNCGPRYTIIQDIPYDRPKTSMGTFTMCQRCQAEYDDPSNRRFHAQPNACPNCGPQLFLTDNKGKRVDSGPADALEQAAALLKAGRIVAVKGLGGFHLAVDACNEAAVLELRNRKKRPDKPFALMAEDEDVLSSHVLIDDKERQVLTSFHRPIVLLEKRNTSPNSRGIAPSVAPGNAWLGVMLPYTPLHVLLLKKGPSILVMTSGNCSGEPLSIDNDDALDAFSHIADFFLFHNRDIYFRADDSIVRVQRGKPRFLRRARGYAPLPVDLLPVKGDELSRVIGLGAGLKSSICLTRGAYGFPSPHIGDLEHPKVHAFYGQTIGHMKKILNISPVAGACDLHPGYYSTSFAQELAKAGLPITKVQHHHAHALSCMAENRLEGEVMAITLDGTGLGTDGHIWGGEILTCTYAGFTRQAHLAYLAMPGGDAAVTEPWRMAASLLYHTFGQEFLSLDIPFCRAVERAKLEFLVRMMERGVNTPLTSSAGRLFDAMSSLLGICHRITHESQAAMALETTAGKETAEPYPFDIVEREQSGPLILDPGCGIRAAVEDICRGVSPARIAAGFHTGLARAFVAAAVKVRQKTGLSRVVLSGGVFNNHRIFNEVAAGLESESFSVYTHSRVPCGDGGISLGQAMAAAFALDNQPDRRQ